MSSRLLSIWSAVGAPLRRMSSSVLARAGLLARGGVLARGVVSALVMVPVVIAGGCGGGAVHSARLAAPGLGGSSQAVFATLGVDAALAGIEPADLPEYGRRDRDLAMVDVQPMLATNQWPEAPRPSLLERRYLQFRSTPGQYIFFFPEGSGVRRGDDRYYFGR